MDNDTELQEAHGLWQRGDYETAERVLRGIVRTNPRHVEATHELGALLVHVGQQRLGVSLIKRAAALEPTASRFNDLGLAYVAADDVAKALGAFRDAVVLDPQFAEGYNSLGRALLHAGHVEPGADAIRRAVELDDYEPAAWARFCAALQEAASPGANHFLASEIARGLSIPGPHREELVTFAIGVVTADTALQAILRAASLGDLETVRAHLFSEPVTRVMDGDLMPRLLAVGVLPSPPYEVLFTELRRRLTLDIHAGRFSAAHDKLPFLCGLARQCYLNGYVWHSREDEDAAVRALETETAAEITNPSPTTPLRIAILAAYRPLGELACSDGIVRYAGDQASEELRDLARVQIEEPARERALLVDDEAPAADGAASCARWVDPPPVQSVSLAAMLGLRFPDLRNAGLAGLGHPRVLVYGCGPGKDAVAWARNVEGASVVGVESNREELGFARRKAEELGQTNIEFVADLPAGTFDLVACPALRGPAAETSAAIGGLAGAVRPGGYVHMGLRARAGRERLASARGFARAGGYADAPAGVRACRRAFLNLPDDTEWKSVAADFDLHTHAGCRELFFGDDAPDATIPDLATALEAHSLEFLGFESDGAVRAYRNAYPGDATARDLDAWARLEAEAPALFAAMYTFWVRKVE